MSKLKLLFAGYFLTSLSLFLYSFTQVDLSLTLSRLSIWQEVQKSLQYVGYFQRPTSATLFVLILFFLFLFYILFARLAYLKKITRKQTWALIIVTTLVLMFSYNAFSYDIFNYIFDAKIVTHYNQNPYEHKALDYPGDPMLSFMRWTHRTYPYGPTWILLSIPFSFVGSQIFLLTFFIFKIIAAASFLGSAYVIEKIAKKLSLENTLLPLVFFAFNPLILIESLVSGHHDIVMMFFALLAFYFVLSKRYLLTGIFLLLSIGIKFATGLLLPVFAYIVYLHWKKEKIDTKKVLFFAGGLLTVAVVFASIRTELQPWYLVWVLSFLSLLSYKRWVFIFSTLFSLGVLLHYVPFLYSGNWDPPIPTIKLWITISVIIVSLLLSIISYKLFPKK